MATPSANPTAANKAAAKASKKLRRTILGKKIGMTQIFTETGHWVPVTVLQAGPCTVLQVKTPERDGYSAVQLGFEETTKKQKKPQQAYLDGAGLKAARCVREVPIVDPGDFVLPSPSDATPPGEGAEGEAKPGAETEGAAKESKPEAAPKGAAAGGVVTGSRLGVSIFKNIRHVDVRGVTKGRGFKGVISRYHFSSGPKSHGTKNIREPGSTGMHTDPGRVLPGKKMPGHLGAVNRKMRNLEVVRIEEADNILVVKGSVPGPRGGFVYIQESL